MSAKKEEAPAKEGAAAAPEAAAPAKGMNPMILLVLVIVLAPVLSLVVGKFLLLPALTKELAAAPAEGAAGEAHAEEAPAEAAHGGEGGGHGKKGEKGAEGGAGNTYEFENVVVNLAGTMGTRYLKVTFLVTGKDKSLRAAFENNKPKMIDVTINVLSSLSLADLEEVGAKNIIREKLLAAYNQALEKRIADQIYFTDFVVQ